MKSFKEKYGPWALITGASSGIGAEFARQLAAKGLNVVLAARRKQRLEELAGEIAAQYKVKTLAIAVDLLQADFIGALAEKTKGLDIGLLVNSAGMMYLGEYLQTDIEKELKMIDLNVKAPALLTHHFGKKMVKRGKGGIIFVASMLGHVGTPFAAAYAGSKAFEVVKGESLWQELKPKGVDVLTLSPGLTDSEMTASYDFSAMPMKLMQVEPVVKAALEALGKKSQVIPGVMNKILGFVSKRIFSRDANTKLFGKLMGRVLQNTAPAAGAKALGLPV